MATVVQSDVLVVGGGLAGIVTAIEALRAGKRVTLVDRDTPERLGGLALWAFGGMALVGTPLQARMKIPDTPARALADWLRFGELGEGDVLPRQWAAYYTEHSRSQVHDWLLGEGVKFMPAVNWVERGMQGDGNSLPRYHVVWGTARELTRRMIAALHTAGEGGRLTLLHRHRVSALDHSAGQLAGAVAVNEATGAEVRLQAPVVVLAMGGINGSHAEVRRNWPKGRPMPISMLNGAHPFADGKLHHLVAGLGAQITHAGEMWNYAAGFPHPFPHFEGHGLSAIPCKSALWLNHRGERIGPAPLVTGFDTHWLCQRVAEQEKPYTWQLMNWRIAAKEFAISGAEHNQRIRDMQFPAFLKETLLGNHRLVPDKLRTCKPAPLQKPGAGPFIAVQMQLITRKSLGGLQTDLQSRVLDAAGQPMPGLYCVGEAAGFGGGASGKRSLEGTFLPGCILTGRAAARSIVAGH
jgi:predicted oxidoreductase